MIRTVLKIDGMMCGMCESHINDCIRRNFAVKKVSSSHTKGETVILSETEPDMAKLKAVIAETGYGLISVESEPAEKKVGTAWFVQEKVRENSPFSCIFSYVFLRLSPRKIQKNTPCRVCGRACFLIIDCCYGLSCCLLSWGRVLCG